MTTLNQHEDYTLQATADLTAQSSRFKVLSINGTLFQTAGPAPAIGILLNSCRSGEYASYTYQGIVKGVAGAAVASLGWPCAPASGGFLISATSGGFAVGRFLEIANSGDFVQVMIDFANLGVFNGA